MSESSATPLIHGFEFDSDGGVKRLSWDDVKSAPAERPGVYRWLHLNRLSPEVRDWLTGTSGIDDVIDASLLQEDTRPRCIRHGSGLLVNLRGVNLNEGSQPEDMIAIRIWMTENVVVSLRAFHIRAAQDLRDQIMAGDVPESTGAIITFIAARLTDRIEPIVAELDSQADDFEDELLQPGASLPKTALANFRRKVLALRRYIIPQREALSHLAREGEGILSQGDVLRLREIGDRVTRIGEELDAIRERSLVLQEQVVEERAERMNQRLFVLAIISAVFLPLGFVTGLFGVNLGGMPGAASPLGFTILCVIMGAVTAGLLLLFRRMRWL